MRIKCNALATLVAALIYLFSSGTSHASTLPFGVFGFPLDLSANVKDAIVPGGTVFEDSMPLFDTVPGQAAELLHISSTGVNASGRSSNISGAFTSSLAEADGNAGVGVSQLIFGSPGGSGQGVRQLFAQSLFTQTFVYNGVFPVDITLHLHVPALQVQLLGVPPRRSGLSATETAEASGSVVAVITHPDLTQVEGSRFDFGLREFEMQIPSGSDLLNLAELKVLGETGSVAKSLRFNGDDFNPGFIIDPFSFDLDLGSLKTGDTLSYVYTLTAEGTTHGFERGYDAFLGDPFGGDVITDNLSVTVAPTGVPEVRTSSFMLLGLAGLFVRRWHTVRSIRSRLGQ
jgi:hypothetical protein